MEADDVRRHAGRYADDAGEAEALVESVRARLAWRRRRGRKRCDRCKRELSVAAFGAHSREPDGLRRECRECRT